MGAGRLNSQMAISVSIIAPTHNTGRRVLDLLDALDRQTFPRERFEVILVDDASGDDTPDLAAGGGRATVIRLEEHGGPYVARNRGIEAACGELLAFTDGDCVPDPRWIERGVAAFERGDVDLLAGHLDTPLGDRPNLATLFDAGLHYDQERYASEGYAAGGNMWVRRSTLERFGHFNERLLTGGDQEFGRRVTSAGGTIRYARDVIVGHAARTSLRSVAKKQFRLGYQWAQHLYHSTGPLSRRPLLCAHPRSYLPRTTLPMLPRLEEKGFVPSRRRRLELVVAQYLFIRVPMLAGNLAGVAKERRLPPRSRFESVTSA